MVGENPNAINYYRIKQISTIPRLIINFWFSIGTSYRGTRFVGTYLVSNSIIKPAQLHKQGHQVFKIFEVIISIYPNFIYFTQPVLKVNTALTAWSLVAVRTVYHATKSPEDVTVYLVTMVTTAMKVCILYLLDK